MNPRHLVTLLLPAILLTGCQATDASSGSSTARMTPASSSSNPPASSTSEAGTTSDDGTSADSSSANSLADAGATGTTDSGKATASSATSPGGAVGPLLQVAGVVDGDTIKVWVDGKREKVRLIGVDTPETTKPGYGVACYGKQASSKMQSLVQSKQVRLVADPTQGDRDRYGRLLRYVKLADGSDVAQTLIAGGFGREYTYDTAYAQQANFLAAQSSAEQRKTGLWGACSYAAAFNPPLASGGAASSGAASGATRSTSAPAAAAPAQPATSAPTTPATGACDIKGNINSKGEKIYHLPGSATYAKTKINRPGEQMFCSEAAAQAAGFRAARD